MYLSSRQNGFASPTSLLAPLQSIPELEALLLPAARLGWESLIPGNQPAGPQGTWLLEGMPQLRTLLYVDPQRTITATLGGESWRTAMGEIARLLVEAQLETLPVGRVVGDCLTTRIDELLQAGHPLRHSVAGEGLKKLAHAIVAARVDLGAAPYVHAAAEGCRVVLGGRAAPGSLAMGRLFDRLPLNRTDWNALAVAMLHATAAELSSLDLEVTEQGELQLHSPRTDLSREGIEAALRKDLGTLALSGSALSLPDVTIHLDELAFEWHSHGGFALRGIAGEPPSLDVGVEIVYALGTETRLLVPLSSGDPPGRAVELADELARRFPLESSPFVKRGVWTTINQSGPNQPEETSLVVHFHADDAEGLRDLYRRVFDLLVTQGLKGLGPPLPPAIATHYECWPTSLPREAIEWDVEIHPAREWAYD